MAAIAVVLAAGEGRRLGGVAKALLPVGAGGGETFLARIAATARAAGVADHAVVVVGAPYGDAVAAAARALGLAVAVNPAPARGMASSVAVGVAAAGELDADVALLWPVDHPWVEAATVTRVLEALAAAPDADAAIPTHGGRGGHPPAIRRALWPALAACVDQPGGARSVLAAAAVVRVEVADAGVVRDVDRPEDR